MIALALQQKSESLPLPVSLSPAAVKSYLSCSLRCYFERVAECRKMATGEKPPSLEPVHLVEAKVPQITRLSSSPTDGKRKDWVVRLIDISMTGISEGRLHPQPGTTGMSRQFRIECKRWPSVMTETRAAA
jgi:hypothetical protein